MEIAKLWGRKLRLVRVTWFSPAEKLRRENARAALPTWSRMNARKPFSRCTGAKAVKQQYLSDAYFDFVTNAVALRGRTLISAVHARRKQANLRDRSITFRSISTRTILITAEAKELLIFLSRRHVKKLLSCVQSTGLCLIQRDSSSFKNINSELVTAKYIHLYADVPKTVVSRVQVC